MAISSNVSEHQRHYVDWLRRDGGPGVTVTLGSLLNNPELGLRLVVGPKHGSADDIAIGWAHGIELVDPRRFLQGGELVMLTGLRLPQRRIDQVAYVDRLVDAQVAVLGFGTGIRFDSIPRAVVARCRETNLPLIEIPLRTPFMAVTQEIARQESEQRTAPLQDLIDLQQTLGRATVRGGIPGLLRRAQGVLGSLAVLDDDGVVLSSAAADWFVTQIVAFVRTHRGRSAGGMTILTPSDESGCALIEVHALTGRRSRRGWLAIGPGKEPGPMDRLLINQVLSLVSLSLDTDDRGEGRRLQSSVLAALLHRDPADPEVLDLADAYGLPGDDDVVLLCAPGAMAGETVAVIDRALTSAAVGHLCRGDAVETLVLVRADDCERAISLIQSSVPSAGAGPAPIGASAALPVAHSAAGAASARRSAASAARRRRPVVRAAELTVESLVADPLLRDHVRDRTEPLLAALAAATGGRGEDMVAALRAFLRHNGSWGEAAADLGVHRHTLASRIGRIEQMTGIDLDDAHQRALLLLAFAARGER